MLAEKTAFASVHFLCHLVPFRGYETFAYSPSLIRQIRAIRGKTLSGFCAFFCALLCIFVANPSAVFHMKTLRSDLMFLWLVATTALCAGLLINQFRDAPLPLVYKDKVERLQDSVQRIATKEAPPALAPAVHLPETLSLEEFTSFVEKKGGLVLDARPEIFHRLGHVPGALSLPRDDFEKGYAALKNKLEVDRSQPIAIYCSGTSCEDSGLLKKSLASLGYTNLALFEGGWGEWTAAKKPEETSE